jgi:hypothetical protein
MKKHLSEEAESVSKRQDTKLESEGAEFLVLGLLLIEGIHCFKAYTNFSGYDLVAVNPSSGRNARIQVKSRWATDYNRRFPVKNFDCDFLVFAALNRGFRYDQYRNHTQKADIGRKPPNFYCVPVNVARKAQDFGSSWGMVRLSNIPKLSEYEEAWHLIRSFLARK